MDYINLYKNCLVAWVMGNVNKLPNIILEKRNPGIYTVCELSEDGISTKDVYATYIVEEVDDHFLLKQNFRWKLDDDYGIFGVRHSFEEADKELLKVSRQYVADWIRCAR
jgi:hypothetical protein